MGRPETINPAHGRGSLVNPSCRTDRNDNTKESSKIQPKFTVQDVTDFLSQLGFVGKVTKRVRTIAWLLLCSIHGFHVTRFDALGVGCSVWNTTCSEIGKKEGLRIERRYTVRKTRFSDLTHCCEYWFPVDVIPQAKKWFSRNRQEDA